MVPRNNSRYHMLQLACLLAAAAAHRPDYQASRQASLAEQYRTKKFEAYSDLPDQYHTYSSMIQAVRDMQPLCEKNGVQMSFSDMTDSGVTLDVIHLKPKADENAQRFKVAAVFGEHSRELISPETSLVAIRSICGHEVICDDCEHDHSSGRQSLMEMGEKMRSAPMDWAFVMNANPATRANLENSGNFCLRLDPEGVDPNRNYPDHFDPERDHGRSPLSQPETRALSKVLEDVKPDTYFSIHSGELGLYGPHAWNTDGPDPAYKEFDVLKDVQSLCPDCPMGPAGQLQGRPLTGSSFDWARDKLKAQYSYAMELFIDKTRNPTEPDECFRFFNPATPDAYTDVTNRFATIIMQTAGLSRDHSLLEQGDQQGADEIQQMEKWNLRATFAQMPARNAPFM